MSKGECRVYNLYFLTKISTNNYLTLIRALALQVNKESFKSCDLDPLAFSLAGKPV